MTRTHTDEEHIPQEPHAGSEIDKEHTGHLEDASPFTLDEEKRLIRRVDIRLVIILGLLYFISLLDRANLGAASVAGFAPYLIPVCTTLTSQSGCKMSWK